MSPWLAVALGAGVFSAVVNVACNTVARKRNSTRNATERVHAGRHTALAAAITLEEFAHRCQVTIDRADQTHHAERIQTDDRCTNVDEFAAYIKGHCAEFGRRAWLMAVELREENELGAVKDHDYLIEFDAALSRYTAWEQRHKVRHEKAPLPSHVTPSLHRSGNRRGGLVVGGPA
jgi:hypothetical protein